MLLAKSTQNTMIKRNLLAKIMKALGLRKTFVSKELGITIHSFRLKMTGKNQFTENEIYTLVGLLHTDIFLDLPVRK